MTHEEALDVLYSTGQGCDIDALVETFKNEHLSAIDGPARPETDGERG